MKNKIFAVIFLIGVCVESTLAQQGVLSRGGEFADSEIKSVWPYFVGFVMFVGCAYAIWHYGMGKEKDYIKMIASIVGLIVSVIIMAAAYSSGKNINLG